MQALQKISSLQCQAFHDIRAMFVLLLILAASTCETTTAFVTTSPPKIPFVVDSTRTTTTTTTSTSTPSFSSVPFMPKPQQRQSNTRLFIWWYGGSQSEANNNANDESCELVAVRIERTSANSRRIYGEIVVPTPLQDVWAILTDYNRLAEHVPNLMESRIVSGGNSNHNNHNNMMNGANRGEQGDGSYRCRLFQRGAQKIIGFDFSASVTMDMQELMGSAPNGARPMAALPPAASASSNAEQQERRILFTCAESFFFSQFDGEWSVQERPSREFPGQVESVLSYVVDVRPKGPVPVAALEWRIREDVPTNLRAVKKAAIEVGYAGVMKLRGKTLPAATQETVSSSPASSSSSSSSSSSRTRELIGASRSNNGRAAQSSSSSPTTRVARMPVKVQWYKDETMAAYLRD